MNILRRLITGLGLMLVVAMVLLASRLLVQDAHASVPTGDYGNVAPASGCDICGVYFADVTMTCNPDGSTHWTATIRNNSDCVVTTGWNANLLVQENYGDFNTVLTVHGGPQDFPPGD